MSSRGSKVNETAAADGSKEGPRPDTLIERSQHSGNSSSRGVDIPEVFLYTTLNQNQTKDIRKAQTNREERKILAQIFNLNAIKKSPNDEINKVD